MRIADRLKYWRATQISNRQQRKELRKKNFLIYTCKHRAIQKAKALTHLEQRVYWVMNEEIGYYVVNVKDIGRLNNNSLKHKGGYKIRTKDLDKTCVWRSPHYSTLSH